MDPSSLDNIITRYFPSMDNITTTRCYVVHRGEVPSTVAKAFTPQFQHAINSDSSFNIRKETSSVLAFDRISFSRSSSSISLSIAIMSKKIYVLPAFGGAERRTVANLRKAAHPALLPVGIMGKDTATRADHVEEDGDRFSSDTDSFSSDSDDDGRPLIETPLEIREALEKEDRCRFQKNAVQSCSQKNAVHKSFQMSQPVQFQTESCSTGGIMAHGARRVINEDEQMIHDGAEVDGPLLLLHHHESSARPHRFAFANAKPKSVNGNNGSAGVLLVVNKRPLQGPLEGDDSADGFGQEGPANDSKRRRKEQGRKVVRGAPNSTAPSADGRGRRCPTPSTEPLGSVEGVERALRRCCC